MVRPFLATLAVALALTAPAHAQRVTAAIDGTIRDESGGVLAGVSVTVRNVDTGLSRETVSDDGGRFLLVSLPVEGVYELRLSRPGFATSTRERVTLLPDQTVTVDVVMRIAVQTTVEVGSTVDATLDRGHAVVRQTVSESLVRELPLFTRGFMPLASLAAGFTGHPNFPSPKGQTFASNNVLVDGASHFSKWRSAPRAFYSGYSLEAVKQVQVLTNLFSAEFGEALASVTSVTTKSGTNVWHGSGLLFVRDDALDAVPAFANRTPPAGAQQFGGSIGGPLQLNRSHLFATYEGRRIRDNNIAVSPAASTTEVPSRQDEHLVFVRIDRQQHDRQLLTARYSGQRFRWAHQPGGLMLPGTGTQYRTDADTALVTDALQFSQRMLGEVRVQYARFTDLRNDLDPRIYVYRAGYSVEGGALGPRGFGVAPEQTWEGANTLSFYIPSHTLRAGGGFRSVRSHARAFTYGRGAYYFGGPPSIAQRPYLFAQSLAPAGAQLESDPTSLSFFGFAQDDWQPHARVSLNLGIRYDVERLSHVSGISIPTDTNNVQPRFGLTWDVTGQGRTVLRGGAGVYTQQHVLAPISRLALEGPSGAVLVSVPDGSPLMPTLPGLLPATTAALVPRDVFRLDPTFRNPFSVQGAIGAQQRFLGGVLSTDVVWLRGFTLLSLVDANAPALLAKPQQRSVAVADATRPSVPAAGAFRKVITLGNQGKSWYRALQVKFDRTAGAWQAVSSYTFSRAEDMASYELPEDSRNLAAEKARAATDVRHNLTAGFTWMVPGTHPLARGWALSGIGVFRSNRPYTISWGDDRNGTTQNDARPGARNTGRTGPYRTVDLSLVRHLRRGRADVEARIEAYNLLNAVNYDEYVGQLLSPFYGQPISAFPQRRLQLAVATRF